jgi:replicative DNA helicase
VIADAVSVERVPPHSAEAERAVLGSALLDAVRVIPMALATFRMKAEMFHVKAHGQLFQAVVDMFANGKPVDLLLTTQYLRDAGILDQVGGNAYVERLIDATPTDSNAEFYCDIVRQKYLARRVIDEARQLISEAYVCERGDAVIRTAGQAFSDLVEDVTREKSNLQLMDELETSWRAAHEAFYSKRPVPVSGLQTPWRDYNHVIGGFEPGLHLLAGRPSAGKTSLEGSIASYWCECGIPVARASLDITKKRLLMRDACRLAGVSAPKLKFGYATQADLARIAEAKKVIAGWPMYITELREIGAICSWIRAMKIRFDIQAFTLDHATLPEIAKAGKGWDLRREVKYVTKTLKALALELGIPGLLLSQLSRGLEKEGKKPRVPRLSDLKESGSLEEDATTVTFAYKTNVDKELELETKQRRPVLIDVQKNQDGETAALEFWLRPHYFRFDRAHPEFAYPPVDEKDPNRPEG